MSFKVNTRLIRVKSVEINTEINVTMSTNSEDSERCHFLERELFQRLSGNSSYPNTG